MLAQITQPPQSAAVTTGEPANFSCSVSSGAEVKWRIDNEDYPMCKNGEGARRICFSNKEDVGSGMIISTLHIQSTGVLGGETIVARSISCVVPQIINASFSEDASFRSSFWNPIIETAIMILNPGELLS